jgi:hypothetical protein
MLCAGVMRRSVLSAGTRRYRVCWQAGLGSASQRRWREGKGSAYLISALVYGSCSQARRLCFVVNIAAFLARVWRSHMPRSVDLASPHWPPTLALQGRWQHIGGCWRRVVA